jgi:itaconate CoA-transferase
MGSSLPLDGITVVSLEHAIAAPLATRHLADLGARVIKVERPGTGDFARGYDERVRGLSSQFLWVNRSKESIAIDLKHPQGGEVLNRLVSRADVVVQNLAPGATARLGLGWKDLHARHPRIILCDISGYGEGGPYGGKKAYDLLIQAEAGLLSVTGTAEERVKPGIAIGDISAGMYAFTNIMAALLQRHKTGLGSHVDVSLLETTAEWMGYPLYYSFEDAPPPPRSGIFHASVFPYGPFHAGDGKEVFFGLQNEREWVVFCDQVLEQPALAPDERFNANFRRSENRAALTEIIEKAFTGLTQQQVLERLERANIANARMNEMKDLWEHPQLRARDRWRNVETPAGPVPMTMPPGKVEGFESRMDPVPALGEHTRPLLAEFGYSEEEIAALVTTGAI